MSDGAAHSDDGRDGLQRDENSSNHSVVLKDGEMIQKSGDGNLSFAYWK